MTPLQHAYRANRLYKVVTENNCIRRPPRHTRRHFWQRPAAVPRDERPAHGVPARLLAETRGSEHTEAPVGEGEVRGKVLAAMTPGEESSARELRERLWAGGLEQCCAST